MAAGDSAGRLGVAIVGVVKSIQHSALTAKIAIMACFESASGIVRPVSKEPSDSDVKTFPKAGKLFPNEQRRGVSRPASALL